MTLIALVALVAAGALGAPPASAGAPTTDARDDGMSTSTRDLAPTATEPRAAGGARLAATAPRATSGDWLGFTGTAPRAWRGERAHLRFKRSPSAAWARSGTVRVRDNGTIAFRRRATGVGRQTFQLVLPGVGRSTKASVVVFRWYYLDDLSAITTEIEGSTGGCTGGCTGFYGGSARIGGRTYSQSWVMRLADDGRRSTTSWNASRKCRTFDATVGLDDESDTTTGLFTINVGGDDVVLATVTTGQGARVSHDLRGVFRFEIAASNQGPGDDADSAWGNARLLCSGTP